MDKKREPKQASQSTVVKGKHRTLTRFPNIKVRVVNLGGNQSYTKKLFDDILSDYVCRKGVEISQEIFKIDIVLSLMPGENTGICVWGHDVNEILIQVAAPWLDEDFEEDAYGNELVMRHFFNTLCHEFVHAAQKLTDNKGTQAKGFTYDPTDKTEEYYFDPLEIEARFLADFYLTKFINYG